VQLATFRPENCVLAQRAIDSYKGLFSTEPKLYTSPQTGYVVVAIPANQKAESDRVLEKAKELSADPRFSHDDFTHAWVRPAQDLKPLPACS
jgi:hypothetical protein